MHRVNLEKGGIYTIPNFLNEDECSHFNDLVFNPPKDASKFTTTGIFTNKKWKDPMIADSFYSKLSAFIEPSDLALRANSVVMTGHYKEGQQFNLHTDTGLFYDKFNREKSRWTLLIYLNDDYEGGNTLFYDDNFSLVKTIQPEKGKALLFDIDLFHRGDTIERGEKQWIGCEIIGKF